VAAIGEFRAFAAENFDELKRGIIESAGFFAGGCFGGVRRNILMRIAKCFMLFICFVGGVLNMIKNFYLNTREMFLKSISLIFAGFGPFVVAVVYNIVSVLVFCVELGQAVLFINTIGAFFGMKKIGTAAIIKIGQLFMFLIQKILEFFLNIFNPFFELVYDVTGWDLRKLFAWVGGIGSGLVILRLLGFPMLTGLGLLRTR
jgi:hypothetical protein